MVSAAFTCLLKYCVEIMYKYGLSVILVKKNKSLQNKHNTAGAKRCAWNRDWSWNWEINIVGRDRVSNSTQCKVSSGLDHYFSNSIAERKVLTFYKDSTEMAWRRNPFQEALRVVDCTIRLTKLCEGDARLLWLLNEHSNIDRCRPTVTMVTYTLHISQFFIFLFKRLILFRFCRHLG